MDDLVKAEKAAWRFYKIWRKHSTFCTALHRSVRKSLRGWWHLKANRSITKRPTHDLVHRYELLPLAEHVIEDGIFVEKRTQHGQIFYAIEQIVDSKCIRVVLVEDKSKSLWFLSITEKNKKTAPLTLPKH